MLVMDEARLFRDGGAAAPLLLAVVRPVSWLARDGADDVDAISFGSAARDGAVLWVKRPK